MWGARPGRPLTPGARGSGPSAGARPGARAAEPPAPPLVSAHRARSPAPLGRRSGGGGGPGPGPGKEGRQAGGCRVRKVRSVLGGALETAPGPRELPPRDCRVTRRLVPSAARLSFPGSLPARSPGSRGSQVPFFGRGRGRGVGFKSLGSEPAKVYKNNSVLCIADAAGCALANWLPGREAPALRWLGSCAGGFAGAREPAAGRVVELRWVGNKIQFF